MSVGVSSHFAYQENVSQENIVHIFVLIFTLLLSPPKFPHTPLNIIHCHFYREYLVLLERAITFTMQIVVSNEGYFFEKAGQL